MKGLVRPHQSSRLASHTVDVTKSSKSMKSRGRCEFTHGAATAIISSTSWGCEVASAPCESFTKRSTSLVKPSNDARRCVVSARSLDVQCELNIVEDRPGVPTPLSSEECRTRVIDGHLVGDHHAGGETGRNGGSRTGPPPPNRRRRNRQVDIVHWTSPHASLIYDISHSFRANCGLPTLRPKGMADVVQSQFPSRERHPPLGDLNDQTSKEFPSSRSLDFHENSSQFVRRFMTTNPLVQISRKASKE